MSGRAAPTSPRTDTDAFAVGAAAFEDVVTIRDFARDSVRPVVARFAKDDQADGTVHGLFLRASAWLNTLAELKEPQHFQAASGGVRALFEICVDLALLHHDRQNFKPEAIQVWEASAKLKAAERAKRRFGGRADPPPGYPAKERFIATHGDATRAARARIWPASGPNRHPDRWTNRSLEVDAEAADGFGAYDFRDFYDLRFADLCWGTHGSGLTLVRGVQEEHFPTVIAMAFLDGARFGQLASKLTLLYLGKFDAIVEARFRAMEQAGRRWSAIAFGQAKGYLEKDGARASQPRT